MRESKPTESDPNNELAAEIARLKTRLQQLEAEVAPRRARSPEREERESLNIGDVPERVMNEGSKLLRSLMLAAVEPIRIAGDLASEFGDEIRARSRPERRREASEKPSERTTRSGTVSALPRDISAGLSRIVDESLNIPGKMVDRFHETYKATESLQRTSTERDLSRAEEALSRAERKARSEEKLGRKPPETEPSPNE